VTETIELEATFSVPASALRDAWLRADQHAALTGAPATGGGAVGDPFTAWGGYIEGRWLVVEDRRLRCSWRTSEFPADAPDSVVELTFADAGAGVRVTLRHTDIPEGQGARYASGWEAYYFAPITDWCSRR
jgi:activator of HSP90 ATPase